MLINCKDMKKLLRNYKNDVFVILFFLIFLPLFFYNLGGTSLVDFDEAWYAEIARNILLTRQPLLLFFNGSPYVEHPPLGFILIAISFLIFKVNEFAARFPSALLSFGSVITLYFIGKNLFTRTVGVGAGLILLSSVWFIFRSRSGNLDTVFLFFYLFTFYAALRVKKNKHWIYLTVLAFSFCFLTKSMIGITITAPIAVLWLVNSVRIPGREIVRAMLLFFLILSPWFFINYLNNGFPYFTHIFDVGLKSGSRMIPNIFEIGSSLTFKYLHFGIREWFYPTIIALVGSLAFVMKKPVLLVLYVWFLILFVGFLTNSKTEIWHLIPLFPIIGLFISYFLYQIVFYSERKISGFLTRDEANLERERENPGLQAGGVYFLKNSKKTVSILVFFLIFTLSLKQIYDFRNEVKLFGKDTSGLAVTAGAARERPEKLYLDNETFLPGAVFYSQKIVTYVQWLSPPDNDLKGIINASQKPFLLLTEKYRLNIDRIDQTRYAVLAEHKGHVLIRVSELK